MESTEIRLTDFKKEGGRPAFETVFIYYFKHLHAFAYILTRNQTIAEELVQEVFYKIWKNKDQTGKMVPAA